MDLDSPAEQHYGPSNIGLGHPVGDHDALGLACDTFSKYRIFFPVCTYSQTEMMICMPYLAQLINPLAFVEHSYVTAFIIHFRPFLRALSAPRPSYRP